MEQYLRCGSQKGSFSLTKVGTTPLQQHPLLVLFVIQGWDHASCVPLCFGEVESTAPLQRNSKSSSKGGEKELVCLSRIFFFFFPPMTPTLAIVTFIISYCYILKKKKPYCSYLISEAIRIQIFCSKSFNQIFF